MNKYGDKFEHQFSNLTSDLYYATIGPEHNIELIYERMVEETKKCSIVWNLNELNLLKLYINSYSEAFNWKNLGERWATSVWEHITLDNITTAAKVGNLTIRPRTVQSLQHKYNELKPIRVKKEKKESTANLIRWTQAANTIVEQKLLPYEQIIDGTSTVHATQLSNGCTVSTVLIAPLHHKKRKAAAINYTQRAAFMELCENNIRSATNSQNC